jgi:uncharacterized membrane protein YtjA (UPF0391 family)
MYEDYPKTLLELEDRFSTEAACFEYLRQRRWPQGFICPRCGAGEAWHTDRRFYRGWRCELEMSVTAGIIMPRTRKPLRLWFRAMWQTTDQKFGSHALGMQRILSLGSYHTAWQWLHKLRRARVRPHRERLNGVIEVDETYVGGKKPGKRGRGATGKARVGIAAGVVEIAKIPFFVILLLFVASLIVRMIRCR